MATTAEYKLGEYAFPRGWFMIGTSEDATTTPKAVRYFGEDMVLYRGETGRVFLVEAYCPHMGTHLANNTTSYVVADREHVEGDNIRCPYHGWRFGPDGHCNQIPYSPSEPPKKARLRSWPVTERAQCLWIWYDAEGGEPDYELPAFDKYDAPHWVNWKIDVLGELEIHPIEILDNMADKSHLEPVHGTVDMVNFSNSFEDHVVRQLMTGGHKTLVHEGGAPMVNDTWYTGPGILQSKMHGYLPSHMLIAHTPLDDGKVMVWHALMVEVENEVPTEEDVAMARQFQEASRTAFAQDFEIWANKRPAINLLMVRGDGPFDKVRIWYKQFYNPRERASEFTSRVNGSYVTKGTIEDPWPQTA